MHPLHSTTDTMVVQSTIILLESLERNAFVDGLFEEKTGVD